MSGISINDNPLISILLLYVGNPKLMNNVMAEIIINVPSLSEQKLIADFKLTFDKKIEIEKQKLEKWKQIKKGLLQQMFV